MSVTYHSELIVCSRNLGLAVHVAVMAHHSSLLIVKGHVKSLSEINTDLVPIVMSFGVHAQMEPSFVIKKCKFWVKETVVHSLQNPVTKMFYSHIIRFFSCLNLSNFVWQYMELFSHCLCCCGSNLCLLN
jgi:hypothetical protein